MTPSHSLASGLAFAARAELLGIYGADMRIMSVVLLFRFLLGGLYFLKILAD